MENLCVMFGLNAHKSVVILDNDVEFLTEFIFSETLL